MKNRKKVIPLTLILLCFQLSLFAQNINFNLNNVSVKSAMETLTKESGYSFVFESGDVNTQKIISVKLQNRPVDEAVKQILQGQDVSFSIKDKNIIIHAIKQNTQLAATQDKKQIQGVVTDNMGEPVIGASIKEKGTTNGTATNVEGRFSLNVSADAVLQVSYIGYSTQEITVGNQNNLSITLTESSLALDEVVVIGYGAVKKSDLTGSVSSIKSKDLVAVPTANILQALQGRTSGLQVRSSNGSPGSAPTVRIRGTNSILGGNDPLYVIDGFPSNSSNPTILDNGNIESVEILKDASAIAIYGSRGANGVVMITTKKGKTGKTKVDFGTMLGYQTLRKKLEVMNPREYATYINTVRINDNREAYFSDADIASFGNGFDWQDFVFQKAPVRTHTLNISGGSEKTQFSIVGNIFDQEGIIRGSGYERYSLSANINHEINKKFSVNYSSILTRNTIDNKNWGGGRYGSSLISAALSAPPTLTPYNDDGSVRDLITAYPFVSEGLLNPLYYINERNDVTVANKVLSNLYFVYTPVDGLQIKILGGIENSDDRNDYYQSMKYRNSQGYASISTNQYTGLLSENTVTYAKTFNRHSLTTLAGFTYQDFLSKSLSGSGTGFLSDITETGNLGSASIPGIPGSGYSKSVLLSWLGRINYSFDNRYLLTVSFRADGSSKYTEGNKWGYFPSAAAAWRMKEEGFLKDATWLSDLKLRASYGVTGSQAISAYATMNNLGSGKTVFNDDRYTYFAPGTTLPGNLKWESTGQFDLGVDVGILDNRFRLTADYYNKSTRDLLNRVQLPTSLGYSSTLQNVGNVQNRGTEFSLDANILTGDLRWNVVGNLTFNKTLVKKLYGGQDIFGGYVDLIIMADNTNLLREGEERSVFYGYLKDGYMDDGTEKYKDLTGDGIVNQEDKTIIGNPNPKFIWGLNSFMSWKGFDLFLLVDGSQGNDIANISGVDNTLNYGYGVNLLKDVVGNTWTPENPNAKYPKIRRSQSLRISDRLIEDGSYLRLRNIELAYNLPVKKWTNWLESMRLYVSLQNMLTITNYSGWDPDVSAIDQYNYPPAKSYTLGINIGF